MGKVNSSMVLFFLVLIIGLGCAPQSNNIPADAIRERSDRAFSDLKAEESGQPKKPSGRFVQNTPRSHTQTPEKRESTIPVQTGKRPTWVDNPSSQYPSAQYLTGVGYAHARQTAEDNARAEIAKILSIKVKARTSSYQEYMQVDSKGKSDTEQTFSMEEITEVSTQKVLSGVRITNVYQENGSNPLFFALAVLDRDQTAAMLQDKIHGLDREIQDLMNRAQQSGDNLSKIKYLKQSLQNFILREAHDSEFRVVSSSGQGISSPLHFSDIKNKLEAILFREFFIGVTVTGDRSMEIRNALIEGLNQQGFTISDNLNKVNVLIRGNVTIKALDRGTPEWKYVEWRTHFDLMDKKGGESVFGSVNKNGRQGHVTLQQAESRAVGKIRKALTTEIAEEVKRYIFFQ